MANLLVYIARSCQGSQIIFVHLKVGGKSVGGKIILNCITIEKNRAQWWAVVSTI